MADAGCGILGKWFDPGGIEPAVIDQHSDTRPKPFFVNLHISNDFNFWRGYPIWIITRDTSTNFDKVVNDNSP